MRVVPAWIYLTCALLPIGLMPVVQTARADELVVYGAGSLREAIGQIASDFAASHAIPVRGEFGPSGRMRERIENGDHVDLFTSADIGHARKLVTDGRATVMAMFARNTLCALATQRLGLTTDDLVERLLEPATRIGISPPKADPLGDYTMELFDRLSALHPEARDGLQARSVIIDATPGSPAPRSGDLGVDALRDGRIAVAIVYCSGRARYTRLMPDGIMTALPPELQVGPEYGLAVLKNASPATNALALAILSPSGQRILTNWGFMAVTLPRE